MQTSPIVLPNVRRDTRRDARRKLHDAGVVDDDIREIDEPSNLIDRGYCIRAEPDPFDPYGVNLFISSGPGPQGQFATAQPVQGQFVTAQPGQPGQPIQPAAPVVTTTEVEEQSGPPNWLPWLIVGLLALALVALLIWFRNQGQATEQCYDGRRAIVGTCPTPPAQPAQPDAASIAATAAANAVLEIKGALPAALPTSAPPAPTQAPTATTGVSATDVNVKVDPGDSPFDGDVVIDAGKQMPVVGYFTVDGTAYEGALRVFGPGTYHLKVVDGSASEVPDDMVHQRWCDYKSQGPNTWEPSDWTCPA